VNSNLALRALSALTSHLIESPQSDSMEQQWQTAGQPRISVVIASVSGPSYLGPCLESLEKQTLRGQAEVIVADRCGEGVTELVRRQYPWVKLLSCERRTIPELQAIAMKSAEGEIIAITEDHCVAEPHWCERILAAHQIHHGAIGGAVENARVDSILDWAEFLCEYHAFTSPVSAGEVKGIPGNNCSYRREFLVYFTDLLEDGFWEAFLHQRLVENGVKFYCDPSIIVFHNMSFSFGKFLSQRYHYSRSYAAMRVRGTSLLRRVAYAGFCPLLPILVLGRVGARIWRRRRLRWKLQQTLPLLIIFSLAWAWGEFWGYLLGAGDSLRKVG